MKKNYISMLNIVVLLTLILCIFGCTGSLIHPIQRQASFILEEYLAYRESGTAIIKGQAFLRQKGGGIITAAGSIIYLNPVTSYSKEYFDLQIMKGLHLSEVDIRAIEYERTTVADINGNFEFHNLPAGEYYITTTITWYVPGRYIPEGGNIGMKIKLMPNEIKQVILTR